MKRILLGFFLLVPCTQIHGAENVANLEEKIVITKFLAHEMAQGTARIVRAAAGHCIVKNKESNGEEFSKCLMSKFLEIQQKVLNNTKEKIDQSQILN